MQAPVAPVSERSRGSSGSGSGNGVMSAKGEGNKGKVIDEATRRRRISIIMRSDMNMVQKQEQIQKLRSPALPSVLAGEVCEGAAKIKYEDIQCNHYERNCDIYAECCKMWFPCRRCHDEHSSNGHKMVR